MVKPRDPNAPKRNMTAYLLYQNAMRETFRKQVSRSSYAVGWTDDNMLMPYLLPTHLYIIYITLHHESQSYSLLESWYDIWSAIQVYLGHVCRNAARGEAALE